MRFLRSNLLIASLLAGAAAAPIAIVACGGDDTTNNPGQPDGSTDDSGPQPDAPVDDVTTPPTDGSPDATQFGTHAVAIRIFELKNAPKAGLPNLTVPLPFILVSPRAGGRTPDAATLGAGPPPLGCATFAYPTLDLNDPKGPKTVAGNAGNILLAGFTGGTVNLPPKDGGADSGDGGDAGPPRFPNPLPCARLNVPPDSGQYIYGCNAPRAPNTFPFLYAPTTDFLSNTDQLTWTGTGGSDVAAFGNAADAGLTPAEDNVTIDQDLWAINPADLDGTKDLVFSYKCGGAACTKPARIGITLTTTDTAPNAANPYDFPPPTAAYAQILCEDLTSAGQNASTYTIRKELIAAMPKTWKAATITVGTLNFAGSVLANGTPVGVSAGTQTFAILKK